MTRSDTNQAVQSQNKARSLKLWIYVEEELYYPCGENKGADQLCSCCTADLRLCFRICKLQVSRKYQYAMYQLITFLIDCDFA